MQVNWLCLSIRVATGAMLAFALSACGDSSSAAEETTPAHDASSNCGNGDLDPGETCDPQDTCPKACSDGIACTRDVQTGTSAECNVACSYPAITTCSDADGCCPAGCDAESDDDCSTTCGNGLIDNGETCDPQASCPMDCNDGNACTQDVQTGSAANCNVACSHQPNTDCVKGDGCCPAGCSASSDDDCSASCGNGVVESGETCDPQSSCATDCSDGNSCTTDLMTGSAANCNVSCGHQPITACTNGDGCCPAGCDANTDGDCSPSCGNGTQENGETCDPPSTCPTDCSDGNSCTKDIITGSAANCNTACSHPSITACTDGDGCCPAGCDANSDHDCSPSCGNGTAESGETCDPPSTCPTDCSDGNSCTKDVMTGSAANCNVACSYQSITECTDGDGCCAAGCTANTDEDCSPGCGNDAVENGETCDPPSTCPIDCDDSESCTQDIMTGSASNCNVTCSHSTITACASGDGCCPAGCDRVTDGDCHWAATSLVGAPSARYAHTAVWTGTEMIVWGGIDSTGEVSTGGRYNPATGVWTPTSLTSAPSARGSHTAIWTGTEMIVWGGFGKIGPPFNLGNGARYNPTTDTWTAISATSAPSARFAHTAVWTGTEMIVWGGEYYDYPTENYLNTGGRYNPVGNSWIATSTTGAPAGRDLHAAVWSGAEMIVWGGEYDSSPVDTYLKTGGRYNAVSNSWTSTSTAGAPSTRDLHTAVWTGSEMIVWGGYCGYTGAPDPLLTGGRYDPVGNGWIPTSILGVALGHKWHTAIWSGTEMIVWGGDGATQIHSGARYAPANDTWTETPAAGAPLVRSYHTAVWTGTEMIVWGGKNLAVLLNSGGRYTP